MIVRTSIHARMLTALMLSGLACGTALFAAQRNDGALSAQQVRELLARVTANQHRNDGALMVYERREHRVTRKNAQDSAPDEDRVFRVVPTGTGTVKLILEEHGAAVASEKYREQLRYLEQSLVWALEPSESRQKSRVQKWQRRAKERHDTVEAAREAFVCSWASREQRGGAWLTKLECVPNPAFKPKTRTEEMFQHARATLWIEPGSAQLARIEAELARDISVGGGVFGKVYSGGRFVMEQAQVAEGIWLPSRFQYDFRGRRFVFGFELHETTLATHYKRIGPPAEALAAVRLELNRNSAAGSL